MFHGVKVGLAECEECCETNCCPHPRGIRSAVTSEFHGAGITLIDADDRNERIKNVGTYKRLNVNVRNFGFEEEI